MYNVIKSKQCNNKSGHYYEEGYIYKTSNSLNEAFAFRATMSESYGLHNIINGQCIDYECELSVVEII